MRWTWTWNELDLVELEYEMFAPLELEPNFECEISGIDDLPPHATPIDYLIGVQPKYSNYKTLESRIDSFNVTRGASIRY